MNRATFEAHKHLVGKGEMTSVVELLYLTEQERLGEEWGVKKIEQTLL